VETEPVDDSTPRPSPRRRLFRTFEVVKKQDLTGPDQPKEIMNTTQWLLNIGLLVFVLGTNLGTRGLTRFRVALPVLIAVVAGLVFLGNIPTLGNDLALDFIGGGIGVALGILAGLFMRIERTADGKTVSKTGIAYAALWILVIGGRVAFAQSADGWASQSVRQFSIDNHITGADAWTAAFIIMALAMVASRVATTVVRAQGLERRSHSAAVPSASRA
jgi:hypothetical protein